MRVKKEFLPVFWVTTAYMILFTLLAIERGNFEFIIYLCVMLLFLLLIFFNIHKLPLTQRALWGLSLWGFLHMSGGNLHVWDTRLYDLQLIPVFLRFDQLVHAFGFGIATLVSYQLLQPYLKPNIKHWKLLSFLVIMIGMGLGALNEVVELSAVVLLSSNGVGDYLNNAFDLVFNLIGGIIAMIIIHWQRTRKP